MQVRAQITKQRIVDAAVDVFDEIGFGSVDLQDIVDRADVTKGAFYYHFATKEAVAAAIIEAAEVEFTDAMLGILSAPPAVENLIRSTFVAVALHERDRLNRVADQLRQSLAQVSAAGAATYRRRQDVVFDVLTGAVSRGIAEGDLRGDIDADKVARTLWSFTIGNRILSVALDQDIFAGLASVWELLLRAIATPESEPYFQQFAARMAQQHSSRRELSG